MVAGAVSPPRLDLANEDLVRAHVHAIWLAETGEWLGNSLTDLLDVEGANPSLTMLPSKVAKKRDCLTYAAVYTKRRNANGVITFT